MAINVLTHRDTDVDNTAQVIKAAPGFLHYVHVANPNTDAAWLHLYDAAAADVTVGTTTPKQSYMVPGGSATNPGGFDLPLGNHQMYFGTAITYAATTTVGGGADPTTGLVLNAHYS